MTALERAARALAVLGGWDQSYADEYDAERYHRENGPSAYVEDVRAVLMAVREPTRGQAEAAGVPLKKFDSWGYDPIHDRQREFTAMIDAILNEGER